MGIPQSNPPVKSPSQITVLCSGGRDDCRREAESEANPGKLVLIPTRRLPARPADALTLYPSNGCSEMVLFFNTKCTKVLLKSVSALDFADVRVDLE